MRQAHSEEEDGLLDMDFVFDEIKNKIHIQQPILFFTMSLPHNLLHADQDHAHIALATGQVGLVNQRASQLLWISIASQ
jgi:hypothetical protein